jgi:hypothetical protein
MIRALTEDRVRRVCAILAGMAAMAVTVVMVTIVIHDRMQWLGKWIKPTFTAKPSSARSRSCTGVPAEAVDVAWDSEGITVQCAGMTFTHQTGDDDNKFISEGEDPVTVTLTED